MNKVLKLTFFLKKTLIIYLFYLENHDLDENIYIIEWFIKIYFPIDLQITYSLNSTTTSLLTINYLETLSFVIILLF